MQALEGIRVLDFTQGMAGPLATMILADYGAEVIRVEPAGGDPWWTRPSYLMWNRGKKSIDLDLEAEDGQARLEGLLTCTDAVVVNHLQEDAEAIGMGYDRVARSNPSAVYLSVTTFGDAGPYRRYKMDDGIVNAKAGRMRDQVGHYRNRPVYRAINDTSYHTAMFAVQGILAALRVAWTTGQGQWVSTSLLRGVTAPNNPWRRLEGQDLPDDVYPGGGAQLGAIRTGALVADRRESDPAFATPAALCTECSDGRWIMHSHAQLELFRAWVHAIDFDWIWEDPRFRGAPSSFPDDADRIELNRALIARMKEKSSAEWIEIYRQNPDCAGEVMRTTQEALRHPQLDKAGDIVSIEDPRVGRMIQLGPIVKMSETPAVVERPAPLPGQHTVEVLSSLPAEHRVRRLEGAELTRPLEGILILEMASWLASPFAGALMSDLGARVIKIEPLGGDPYRAMLSLEPPSAASWATDNMVRATQGKESLAIDLKTESGREVLHRLVARTDVLFHNFRPGAPERLGMDYETVRRLNPEVVYLYASSYGAEGPDSMRAAFNPTMGALTGNSVFQSGEGNVPIGDQSPDPIAGDGVATGIMLGLAARWRTGKGQYLETTMMKSIMYCNSDDAFDYEGKPPRRSPDPLQLGLEATYRLYETDAGWVFLSVLWDEEFRAFCSAAGLADLGVDIRFQSTSNRYEHRVALAGILEPVFKARGAPEWEDLLTRAGVGCVRADEFGHRRFLHVDRHTLAVDFMVAAEHPLFSKSAPGGKYWRHPPVVDFSATPCEHGKAYEDIGEHTQEILHEFGYDGDEIRDLKDAGVVTWPTYKGEDAVPTGLVGP